MPWLLEFKLGTDRHPGILGPVLEGAVTPSDLPGAGLCLDVGEWILAGRALGRDPLAALLPWAPFVRVVHVHAMRLAPDGYRWVPLRPGEGEVALVVGIGRLILRHVPGVRSVFKYTSQDEREAAYAQDGALWFRNALFEG